MWAAEIGQSVKELQQVPPAPTHLPSCRFEVNATAESISLLHVHALGQRSTGDRMQMIDNELAPNEPPFDQLKVRTAALAPEFSGLIEGLYTNSCGLALVKGC